ncbi:RNA-directed DNA polymerase, eukaryota, reverse transcriptase zinc-binding domain protein [Tanacetum coccineum]
MTNMKKPNDRSNKQNVKLSVRYNDHIMSNLSQKGANSESYKNLDIIRVNDEDNHSSNDELGVDTMGMSMDECDLNSSSVRSTENDKYDKVGNNGTKSVLSNKERFDKVVKGINKLRNIPIGLNELGEEVVILDEELVRLGSKKWELTLCGQCVGHNMSMPMVNYHLRRMWSRYGFKEIIYNGNGRWLFKFNKEDGMLEVATKSPWIVNGKPLLVYKWDPMIGLDKIEPMVLPVWVLVEIEAVKGLKENVEAEKRKEDLEFQAVQNRNKRPIRNMDVNKKRFDKNGFWGRKIDFNNKVWQQKQNSVNTVIDVEKMQCRGNKEKSFDEVFPRLTKQKNHISKSNVIGECSNKFSMLNRISDDDPHELIMLKDKMLVDKYLNLKLQPGLDEMKKWTDEMRNYFKRAWEVDREKERNEKLDDMEGIVYDVLEDESIAIKNITANVMNGKCSSILN